jgi:hypothetical protein
MFFTRRGQASWELFKGYKEEEEEEEEEKKATTATACRFVVRF